MVAKLGGMSFQKFHPSPGHVNYVAIYGGERFAIVGKDDHGMWWSSPDRTGDVLRNYRSRNEAANAALLAFETS